MMVQHILRLRLAELTPSRSIPFHFFPRIGQGSVTGSLFVMQGNSGSAAVQCRAV